MASDSIPANRIAAKTATSATSKTQELAANRESSKAVADLG
jgi:hypothetical protein